MMQTRTLCCLPRRVGLRDGRVEAQVELFLVFVVHVNTSESEADGDDEHGAGQPRHVTC